MHGSRWTTTALTLALAAVALPGVAQEPLQPAPTEGALIGRWADGMSDLMTKFRYEVAAADKSGAVGIELALEQFAIDSLAATMDLEASVAAAELRFAQTMAQVAEARSFFASNVYQAYSRWNEDMQRAWSDYYSGVNRATQVATDNGRALSRVTQRSQELVQSLSQSLQSGDLASLTPSLQPSVPDLCGMADETSAAVAAADTTIREAEKAFDAEVALQQAAARGAIATALKDLAQDPDGFRAACDDAIKVLRLKLQDAYDTLATACRSALLKLSLAWTTDERP